MKNEAAGAERRMAALMQPAEEKQENEAKGTSCKQVNHAGK
ncbi:MAG: hypothetical protein PUC26_03540 [Eubacteriales bacterium]|jgi:hypothetical protein|nr:hypothetical protein [Eubacteriales bacterium]